MAADLTADDLLSPAGRLIPKVHFPGQSLSSVKKKLTTFLAKAKDEGAGSTDLVEFTRARAYERAFDEVYQRLIVVAADVSVDEGRRAFLADQMRAVQAERDKYADAATALLPPVTSVAPLPAGETRSIGIRFTGPRTCGWTVPMTEAEARRWSGR